ncbi:hypothetical protein A1WO_01321 [Escherichia coli KTE102]|nr:hypothetical protein A1WO_01321 [Escherichia coli KTE102]
MNVVCICLIGHLFGFAPIFPDTCYHLTHYWLAAVDIPVASDNPVHYADAIRYNARGNDSNLLIVFYVQIMPDDFVMQLHRF